MDAVRSQSKARAAVLSLIAGLALTACTTPAPMVQGGGGADDPMGGGADDQDTAGLETFYEQQIAWSSCGSHYECGSVTVPIDYDDPRGGAIELALKKLVPTGGADQSILVNPGGPGGSGVELVESARQYFDSDVLDRAEIVGLDPRGVGASDPIGCLTDAELDEWYTTEFDLDTDDGWDAFERANEEYGQACLEKNGDLLGHVDTVSAARDMDVVRATLGHDSLDYVGFSYGTYLGATYAGLFPDRVGRFVLDGAIDPALSYNEIADGQAAGFEAAYRSYLSDCLRGDTCPFTGDVDQAYRRTLDLLDQLGAEPADTGDPDRPATDSDLIDAIIISLYSTQSWPILTQALDSLISQGDAGTIKWLADYSLQRESDGSYPNDQGAFTAINCLDFPVDGSRAAVQAAAVKMEKDSPMFGPYVAYGQVSCATWPFPSSVTRQPIAATGAPPIVVIGTERDPATPYEWAESLASELDSGVFLGYDGDGHTAYGNGSCIDDLVEDFLLNGAVPQDGTVC